MIYCKTQDEIEAIRRSCNLVSLAIAEVGKRIAPGVKTIELDELAKDFIRQRGGEPAFLGYRGFPKSLCISVNDAVVHGIPSDYGLKEGDIVSIDCGVLLDGFYGDSAYTFAVGNISDDKKRLMHVTREALDVGVSRAKIGLRIGDIASAIQDHAEKNGYSIVRELVGHGVGKKLHEDPEVPNYGKRGSGHKLLEGMVIAIEPMVNMGKKSVYQAEDHWTILTEDHKPSAHFEHTVAITRNGPDILTNFEAVDEVVYSLIHE